MRKPIRITVLALFTFVFTSTSFSQNVGIGITTPLQKLHVDGTARLNSLSGVGNRMVIADGLGDLSTQAIPTGDVNGVIAGAGLAGGGNVGTFTIAARADNGLNVDATADRIRLGGPLLVNTIFTFGNYSLTHNLTAGGSFLIQDNGLTRFMVNGNGRTTVGGVGSAGRFNVTGDSYFSDDIWLRDGSVTSGDDLVRIYDSSSDGVIDVYNNDTVVNRLNGNGKSFINGGGLGVGTDNPISPIHFVYNGLQSVGLRGEHRSTSSSSYAMDLKTTSLTQNTSITGIRIRTATGSGHNLSSILGGQFFADGWGQHKTGIYIDVDCGGATAASYGIRTSFHNTHLGSGPQYAGYFGGDVYTTGSYLPSHRALKQNIVLASSTLASLMQLRVTNYEYRTSEFEDLNLPKGKQIGLIADQVKILFPELVKKTIHMAPQGSLEKKDIEFEAVNYTGLIPVLVKGTQEQQEEIDALKEEIEVLKSALAEMASIIKEK